MEALKKYFMSVEDLSPGEMDFLLSHIKTKEIPKGTPLFQEGDLVRSIYFLESGVLHHFNYTPEGEKKTLRLRESPCFCTDLESFSAAKRTDQTCVAMTDCTIHELSKPNYDSLINSSLRWSNFVKTITELSLVKVLEEIKEIANKSVRERYHELAQKRPGLLQVVPLQIIASYLGTSRETLHRIRRTEILQNS
ncbi:MAG: Crp/Fnr family transcriptional regulator [Bacteroidota bacterium]